MPKAKVRANAGGKVNKSAWIRSQPFETPAKEVVEKAKREGISLSLAQVYTARSTAKQKPGPVARRGRPPASARGATGDTEAAFRRFVVQLGLDRIEAMLSVIKRNAGF